MDNDVFPRRNLGKGEYWGRTIERDVVSLTKEAEGAGLLRKSNNRSNVAVAAELARNIERVGNLAEETAALIASTPATGSKGAYTDNFALSPGWQTVLVTAIPAVDGRPILDVFSTAVIRIVDPGTGGGSGGGAFSWPFPPETVTSEYGPRNGRMHQGIDFGISEGTPIPASNAGTVIGNGYGSGTGYYVDLSHSGGIVTRYFHMVVQSDVGPPGTVVSKGQTIGLVGNTGNSFGAHLHWETIVNGEHWNPRDFMSVYGDGAFAGGSSGGGGGEFSNPRARIYLNGNPSYDFWPHRDVGGEATLNQLFPVQALSNFPSQAGQADAELQIFSQTNVPADPGNFARLTVEAIFRPPT